MKKKYAKYLIIAAAVIYAAVCFITPEHAETVGKGWSLLINGILLLMGV